MSNNIDIAIGVVDGKVIAGWKDPIKEISFDAKNAYMIGLALCRAAMDCHRGSAAPGKDMEFIAGELSEVKIKVSEEKRMYLVNMVASIIRSLQDQKKQAGYIALHCVDAVLRDTAR